MFKCSLEFCRCCYRRRLAGDNNNDGTQQPNVDIQLRLIEAGESKDMPGGETYSYIFKKNSHVLC